MLTNFLEEINWRITSEHCSYKYCINGAYIINSYGAKTWWLYMHMLSVLKNYKTVVISLVCTESDNAPCTKIAMHARLVGYSSAQYSSVKEVVYHTMQHCSIDN